MTLNNSIKGLVLVLSGLAVGVVAVEMIARFILGSPVTDKRTAAYFSSGALIEDDCGAVHYAPNRLIRAAALYGEHTEYDVSFRTNNRGYVDLYDYTPRPSGEDKTERIAFVGDSFTAGFHGGDPWVANLRGKLRKAGRVVEVYNLGVSGTGLAHFAKRLKCEHRVLDFDHIVIAAISDDLERWKGKAPTPREERGKFYFCYADTTHQACLQRGSRTFAFPDDTMQVTTLIRRIKADVSLTDHLRHHTHVGTTLRAIKKRLRGTTEDKRLVAETAPAILRQIRADMPDKGITFLHLPQKQEVRRNAYDFDPEHMVRENL